MGMRFQERDKAIIQAIYAHGGVMAKRQLKEIFWPDKSERAFEKRLSKLYTAGFVAWPTKEQWRSKPLPEPIVWLDLHGILLVAAASGVEVAAPLTNNENQLRHLEKRLRDQGIHWLREPRWSQLEHDLAINDVRLMVEMAAKAHPNLQLEEWVHEGSFRSVPDVIEYEISIGRGEKRKLHKGVLPDSYFVIEDESRRTQSARTRARFLLEIDLATHDTPSFGREKVLPGIAYIVSPEYKARFGDNSGRWLVVTTGERRLQNLKRQTETLAGGAASVFFFTTFSKLSPGTILTGPIWLIGGGDEPQSLL